MIYGRFATFAAIVLTLSGNCGFAAETFKSLAGRIPRAANAIVLIDVEQILATPLAQAGGWSRKLELAYVERPVFLPPEANKLALGAVLQSSEDFLPRWEVAVMELKAPVGVHAIARSSSGYVDNVAGQSVAIIPAGAAFVDLGGNVLAAMRPADRQFLSRWIAVTHEGDPTELSDYLVASLELVNERVQVLLAIDLADVISPRDIEQRISEADWAPKEQLDRDAMTTVLASVRGAALRVAIGNDCQGQLQVDFGADIGPIRDYAEQIVLQAFENLGMQTQDMAKWEVSTTPRSIKMRGALSPTAMRRIFSVVELPAVDLQDAPAPSQNPGEITESEIRERSLTYFKSAQVLLDDLRRGLKDTKATSSWMERYARRIDELPVLNVDELLLDYGDKLAETLRVMSLSSRQAGIRYGVRATESRGGSYYDGYYYGDDAYSRAADRSQARKEEMAVASDARVQGWKLIDDATADIRRTLTQKYQTEF